MYTCMVFENIRVGVDVVHVEPLMFPGCKWQLLLLAHLATAG